MHCWSIETVRANAFCGQQVVVRVNVDMCQFGMSSVALSDGMGPAPERTVMMTNSTGVAERLQSRLRCRRNYQHAYLHGAQPKMCQSYPDEFCEQVCLGMKDSLKFMKGNMTPRDKGMHALVTEKYKFCRGKEVDEQLSQVITQIMSMQTPEFQDEIIHQNPTEERRTPHEEDHEVDWMNELFRDDIFFDDISGEQLDKVMDCH